MAAPCPIVHQVEIQTRRRFGYQRATGASATANAVPWTPRSLAVKPAQPLDTAAVAARWPVGG